MSTDNDNNTTPSPEDDLLLIEMTARNERRNLPHVNIPGGRVSITESAERLFRIIAPTLELFNRGGKLVEIVEDSNEHSFRIVDAVAAQSRFEKYVNFVKTGKDKVPVSTPINEATARQYLASEAFHERMPKINGVIQCPLLVEKDKQLHLVNDGYDAFTGYYVVNAKPVQEMPLKDAVVFLKALVKDFDFMTPGDRSRALASIITPALKLGGLIKGPIPMDVAEADQSQAGKTYRQKVLAAVYNQKLAVVSAKRGGVGSLDESFSECLVKGATFIQFDNVRGKLDSQFLESFLTGDHAIARVPYKGGIEVNPANFIVMISSNGFITTKDLANRSSIIRIAKRVGYNYPVYPNGGDLLSQAFVWQPMLLGAVFTIIRHWYKLGKLKTNEQRHDFKEWCQTLDWIIQNTLGEAPLMDGHEEAKERTSNPDLTFLRLVAVRIQALNLLDARSSATELFDLCHAAEIEIPGIADNHRHDAEAGKKQIGKIMANLFGTVDVITLEGVTVTRIQETVNSQAGNWLPTKSYVFSQPGVPAQAKDEGEKSQAEKPSPTPPTPC